MSTTRNGYVSRTFLIIDVVWTAWRYNCSWRGCYMWWMFLACHSSWCDCGHPRRFCDHVVVITGNVWVAVVYTKSLSTFFPQAVTITTDCMCALCLKCPALCLKSQFIYGQRSAKWGLIGLWRFQLAGFPLQCNSVFSSSTLLYIYYIILLGMHSTLRKYAVAKEPNEVGVRSLWMLETRRKATRCAAVHWTERGFGGGRLIGYGAGRKEEQKQTSPTPASRHIFSRLLPPHARTPTTPNPSTPPNHLPPSPNCLAWRSPASPHRECVCVCVYTHAMWWEMCSCTCAHTQA